MLLLVPVHAASLLAINGHPGGWATGIFWVVHVFRLPLFFAMSGFFLALLISRRGLGRTARNRTVRIVVPLAVGLVTFVPLTVLVARYAGTALAPEQGISQPGVFAFEPNFLWFLWYLLIIDGVAIAFYLLAPKLLQATGQRFSSLICRPLGGILLLAVPTTLALWPEVTWTVAPPGDSFVPELPALLYYGLFFGLGATLCTHRELVDSASRHAWRWAACALTAAVPAGVLFSLHNSSAYGSQPVVHLAALLIYAVATWTTLIALVGLANRYLNRPRPALRYLADSSYWIYLSHLPAMVLVVGLLEATTLGTGPQFLLATVGALAFSLATYPLFVRYTMIGRVLNGPRTRPQRRWRVRSGTALPDAPG
jgi:peptidoglycan/LPS O-acetylase OafA/YrhL